MAHKIKYIYVVTTVRFGYKWSSKRRNADGIYHSYRKQTHPNQHKHFTIIDKRTWGWFSELKDAKRAIKENWADMYEGDYEYAVIEKTAEGILHGGRLPREWWFKWEGSWEKGGYKPGDFKPQEYHNVIGFGLG